MKYSIVIILVATAIAVTNCAPSTEQEKDFEKFLQFVKNACQEKTINYKLLEDIMKDPNFNIRFIAENSEKAAVRIQMMICPEQKSIEQELPQINSKATKYTSATVQTTLPPESFRYRNVAVSDHTIQDIKPRQIDSVDIPNTDVPQCKKGSIILELLCKFKGFFADMVSRKVDYLLQCLRAILA